MTKEQLLLRLPEYQGKKELLKREQSVSDIVREVLNAHEHFAADYDRIADLFTSYNSVSVLRNLFSFLKLNVPYSEESERAQIVKGPAAILETSSCDCKCYALFIAGVVDALRRLGYPYDWGFAFAGYKGGGIQHVFVVVNINGKTYWVDPTLQNFDQRTPVPTFLKIKRPKMALYRLSGVGYIGEKESVLDSQTAKPATCFAPMDSVDQQLSRIMPCGTGGELYISDPPKIEPVLYNEPNVELAVKTQVAADVLIPPGGSGEAQSSNGVAPSQGYALTDGEAPGTAGGGSVMKWVKENKLLVGGAALLLLLMLSKKSRR